MIGFRTNAFADTSIGEQEQDANSALTELDKGLRSGKVGEQCEAIVRFPRLFEKYPFPILINSSFLKLSDVFRMGNNFLRLWVLRVCQQSEKHLDKILNVDEFLRRIFSVLHSNDPLARALALRTLGAVAGIIPERQNVHHAIRRGLDSQDNVEVDAAIYATTRFAAHSNAFALAMCNKISDMVESESTAPERRDKLVRALRTVHGGAIRAEGVLSLLHSLMQRYPSASFLRNSVAAITAIADDTVVHVPDQVEFLLKIVESDPRASVRRAALAGLVRLAEQAALWSPLSIQTLVTCASDTRHAMLGLQVMQKLVKCPAVCGAAGSLARFCLEATLSADLDVASTAAVVLTDIVVHCYKENLPVEGADLMMSLESLVVATGQHDGKNYMKPLKIVLRCLVQLSNAEPALYAPRTAQLLGNQLRLLSWSSPIKRDQLRLVAILEGLAALGGGPYCPISVQPAMPAVVDKLREVAEFRPMETDNQSESTHNATALVLLCTVLFQQRAGTSLQQTITNDWESIVTDAVQLADPWTKYRVARAALRYGHHNMAVVIVSEVSELAPSEAAQRWLVAIKRAAQADAQLEKDGIAGLEVASAAWELAGEAAASATCGGMAGVWCAARASALAALAVAAAAARALCSQPPPAVAMATAQATRSPATKSGACAAALRRASRALANAASKYRTVYSHSFHADDETLRHLEICEQTYTYLSQYLERISSWNYRDQMRWTAEQAPPANLEEKIMLVPLNRIEEISNSPHIQPPHNGITHTHAASVLSCVSACTRRTVWPLGAWCARQDPLLRLSVCPAPRQGSEHAATIPASHHLAVHIEGLIKMPPKLKRTQKQREVKAVQLTVTVTPHPRTNEKAVEISSIPPILTAVQVVKPVKEFFSGSQLVGGAGIAAVYTVAVSAAAVDSRAKIWPVPYTHTLLVKAHEDPTSKSSNTQAARRF